jgi:hypothetical protein
MTPAPSVSDPIPWPKVITPPNSATASAKFCALGGAALGRGAKAPRKPPQAMHG